MNEKVIQFGPEKNMLGIVSVPDSIDENKPAIIILNSGLIHRVGPYRMTVVLARELASLGFLVFRFDLPNIGDSTSYKTTLPYKERTVSEISSALDVITKRYKINQFVSVGLCTGAMNTHIITCHDERVKGAVMLDAYSYPTLNFLIKRYANKLYKLLNPLFVLKLIKERLIDNEAAYGTFEGVDYWETPPQAEITADLKALMNRDTELMYIYSGGLNEYFNYTEQFRDNFKSIDFKDHLDVHFLEEADHTYTLQKDRDHMLSLIVSWFQSKF